MEIFCEEAGEAPLPLCSPGPLWLIPPHSEFRIGGPGASPLHSPSAGLQAPTRLPVTGPPHREKNQLVAQRLID